MPGGIVTSTTALVNGEIPPDHVPKAALDSGIGIRLHVNASPSGLPSPARPRFSGRRRRRLHPRCPPRGRPGRGPGTWTRRSPPRSERFASLFRPVPHAPRHRTVRGALLPPVRDVVLRVGRVGLGTSRCAARTRRRAAPGARRGLATPDHFFGESGPFGPYWTPERTIAHLRRLPPGVSEFMTHPGYCDAALSHSRYGRQREIGADRASGRRRALPPRPWASPL